LLLPGAPDNLLVLRLLPAGFEGEDAPALRGVFRHLFRMTGVVADPCWPDLTGEKS
jgi:hypothetical protein